jgi:hypothetical protein
MALSFSADGRALAAKRTLAGGRVTRLWYAPSLAEIADADAQQARRAGSETMILKRH